MPGSGSTVKKFLIVNDSPMLTAVIRAVIESQPGWQIGATAADGREAVMMAGRRKFDLVLMDIHMPRMNGVEAVRRIMRERPNCRILITTATLGRNMAYIFDALKYGAIDFTRSPSLTYKTGTPISKEILRRDGAEFLRKVQIALSVHHVGRPVSSSVATRRIVGKAIKDSPVLGIGASTGGPTTLALLLKRLSGSLPGPIMISLHIEPGFDTEFGRWLSGETGFSVEIPGTGADLRPGRIYLAPAGKNLVIAGNGLLSIEAPLPKQIYTPNIDRMFLSMAGRYGSKVCGIVLTGMGNDGARGLQEIKERGGLALAQDRESAIIDGMPKAARQSCGIATGLPPVQLAFQAEKWLLGKSGIRPK